MSQKIIYKKVTRQIGQSEIQLPLVRCVKKCDTNFNHISITKEPLIQIGKHLSYMYARINLKKWHLNLGSMILGMATLDERLVIKA